MKRTISILLSVLLVLAAMMTPVLADGAAAALTDAKAPAASTATLTLGLSGLEKGNTIGVEIAPEDGLTFLPAASKWLIDGALSDVSATKAVWAAADGSTVSLNTNVLRLAFTVPAAAAEKTEYKVNCTVIVKNDSELVGTYTAEATVTPAATSNVVDTGSNVPVVKTEIPVSDLLTEEEKKQVEAGAGATVKLVVENIDASVPAEEKKLAEETVVAHDPAAKIAMFLDVDLVKIIGEADPVAITEAGKPVRVTVDIPADLVDESLNFYVVRIHDGEVEILPDLDDNPNTVTFETDRFSTYGLAYGVKAVEAPAAPPVGDNPNTGDTVDPVIMVGLMAISALSIAILCLLMKKRKMK